MRKPLLIAMLAFLSIPSLAAAQTTAPPAEQKRWGVIATFTPMWKANQALQQGLFWSDPEDDSTPLFEGNEFTIGFARGSERGGDWGVSYVRKALKDFTQTTTYGPDSFCPAPNNCQTYTSTSVRSTHDVIVEGVEVHFFIPFARLANERVQLGINVGGGMGFSKGTFTETQTDTLTSTLPPSTQIDTYTSEGDVAGEIVGQIVPLVKAEFQASFRVARGLKINANIGMNAPSAFAFRIGVLYLFGAK
jgi:opacity protein-like surface antigen